MDRQTALGTQSQHLDQVRGTLIGTPRRGAESRASDGTFHRALPSKPRITCRSPPRLAGLRRSPDRQLDDLGMDSRADPSQHLLLDRGGFTADLGSEVPAPGHGRM